MAEEVVAPAPEPQTEQVEVKVQPTKKVTCESCAGTGLANRRTLCADCEGCGKK